MEMLHRHCHVTIFTLILHLSLSSSYSPSVSHFINCGSSSAVSLNGRTFDADHNSVAGKSTAVRNPDPSSEELYRTARLFRNPALYELETPENGVYVVKLHFYPYPSLLNAQFSVSISGFSLLSNFSPSTVIKEFLVPIYGKNIKIYFEPSPGSSFAFINAIELFILPEKFIPDGATRVTQFGNSSFYSEILAHTLYTIHRVNVGGDDITPDSDTLWRYWVPDDGFLINSKSAKRCVFYSTKPNYGIRGVGLSTEEIAPSYVYQTAKEMDIDSNGGSNNFNITWHFNVSRNTPHLVRAHFCDIISGTTNLFQFNFYVYSNFSLSVNPFDPYALSTQLALGSPFYYDFVVDSDSSSFINISTGPSKDRFNKTAFLNGLEIMELIKNTGITIPNVKNSKNDSLIIIIGSVTGGLVLILVLIIVTFFCFKRYKKAKPVESSDWQPIPMYGLGSTHSRISEATISGSPLCNLHLGLKLSFADIQLATRNFDPKMMIGEGGFGKVYMGTLKNGLKVAVKRSEPGHGQGFFEFQTEIMVLSQIRHRHLVSLIGYCDEKSEMILVYEFMEKGTLRDHLYSSEFDYDKSVSVSVSKSQLPWNKRLEICIGAANGLHYLHASRGIIHRDVKSTNILLDENYVAKVADFGLSRLEDETQVSTNVKGSFGYLDPEYFHCLQLTQKSDVYSFGVVLLEALSSRPAIDNTLPSKQINLAEWGVSWLKKGELSKITDPFLVGKINPNSLRKFGETVEKCLKGQGVDRPSMEDVMWDLEYALQLQNSSKIRIGEPLEDSVTEASWALPAGSVRDLPSDNMVDEYDISTADFSEDSRMDLIRGSVP